MKFKQRYAISQMREQDLHRRSIGKLRALSSMRPDQSQFHAERRGMCMCMPAAFRARLDSSFCRRAIWTGHRSINMV
jgi:hypothetical protein